MHLRTVSSHSLRHGISTPAQLVEVAAQWGQQALALTDRDGLYGAVLFAQACQGAGIAPILGVDLGLRWPEPHGYAQRRSPVRGGAAVPEPQSRAVVLAKGGKGWAALCRLVSAAHAASERGHPLASPELIAEYAAEGDLIVLLGADSDVGVATARRRRDQASARLRRWYSLLGPAALRVEIASHRARDQHHELHEASTAVVSVARSDAAAARLLAVARQCGVAAVLSNAVRYAEPTQAPVADLLDAIRRLVPLQGRHRDQANGEGYLKNWAQLQPVFDDIARLAGEPHGAVGRLLAHTRALAEECALDPLADIGLGDIHVPELAAVRTGGTTAVGGATATVGRGHSGGTVRDVLAGYGSRRRSAQQLESEARQAHELLRHRCQEALGKFHPGSHLAAERLHHELEIIGGLGFAGYFLTVAEVVDLIKDMGIRVAARGSGAGSLVNQLLGISGVDPIRHNLLMERFLSPLRRSLPDIDVDVESARRTEIYENVLARFGPERCACVSMRDSYRVRHAIRDVGAALGMPPGEIDAFATAFPHIRARDVRAALSDLPELRDSGIGRLAQRGELEGFLDLVESLDGLPRHIAVHPCGVVLSDATMLDRTPVEASALGFPMSQFDKDEVEALGFLKLDVLGIRMQSALQHAVTQIRQLDDVEVDLDELPLDDPDTFALIRSTKTLGCFQIESPGQRELLGKFAPETFEDIIADISLFRPGPVKSDMITPFLAARHGWRPAQYIHDDLRPALAETYGVVVYHEQVLRIMSVMTGCDFAVADEARRDMGDPDGQQRVRGWFYDRAHHTGYELAVIDKAWEILRAFASFGFCKAHAAAFALPTYQSAWVKAHYPAAFFAGVLTHDPGMYPKRLILDDARNHGVEILPLDVNRSMPHYQVEPTAQGQGIRLALSELKGITDEEVNAICGHRPFLDLADFWHRAQVSRPTVERLIVTGAFDALHGLRMPGAYNRRDLLLQVADLQRYAGAAKTRLTSARGKGAATGRSSARRSARGVLQEPAQGQLALELVTGPATAGPSGLPDMSPSERVQAELEALGMDVSSHLVDFHKEMLRDIGATRSTELLRCRARQEILVGGVKVATQTPPIRTGHRVVFLTLDDGAGPIDATFFPDAQGPYAHSVFHSWLMLVRGTVRRTGPRGVSIRATGCWDLAAIRQVWLAGGAGAVVEFLAAQPSVAESAPAPAGRVWAYASGFRKSPYADIRPPGGNAADARSIVRDASTVNAQGPTGTPPAKLWHSSPGSSGR